MARRYTHRRFPLVRMAVPLAFALAPAGALAQAGAGGRFDLTGPSIDVHVQRENKSLPISMVPNLQGGDKLTIHADLPATQSVKLVLVVAFLRGSTNPPTDDWFTRVNTWDKKVKAEGVTVTVPAEAQQALLFLAPETGGDYSTLKSAVRGRPGVFVRAAQDLNEASFEQARIERYLQAIRRVPPGSPTELLDHSHKLAATLNLKPNEECFKKAPDQQLSCLRQTGSQVLLDDGHGQTLASMLASGDSANLIGAVAGTPMANAGGAGVYSAYVGTVIDVVRLMSGLHTAQFQYIPAIAFPNEEQLNLRLNTAPSFHNPKSVIVVALPAIQHSMAPPLRLQDPGHVSCLLQPAMVLPLEGAPLVFATGFAHDLSLHLNEGTIDGKADLPLMADAYEGGFVLSSTASARKPLATAAPQPRESGQTTRPEADPSTQAPVEAAHGEIYRDDGSGPVQMTGTLHGAWGFDTFEGVTVPLQRRAGSGWTAATRSELIAGRSNQLLLRADGVACASQIDLDLPGKDNLPLDWRQAAVAKPGAQELDVKLPLEKAAPGSVRLLVHQYGTGDVQKVIATAYSDRTQVQMVRIHAGDAIATLSGSGLGEVEAVRLAGREYNPAKDQQVDQKVIRLMTKDPGASGGAKLDHAGQSGMAQVLLSDGRTLPVSYLVDEPRPSLQLLGRTVRSETNVGLPLHIASEGDLPSNSRVSLALQSISPAKFSRAEKVEIALGDGSLSTKLSLADSTMVLQDAHTAIGSLYPAKVFGASAFGPLQFRAVLGDGTAGDWMPLGSLVRTPVILSVVCPRPLVRPGSGASTDVPPAADAGCTMTGSDLFLIDSVAGDSSFSSPAAVPVGFAGDSMPVPRPADNHTLYLKLRDDTATSVSLSVPSGNSQAPRRSQSGETPAQ